jgi:asparagine N-glycosylation enzyme membrane subunit Stt3
MEKEQADAISKAILEPGLRAQEEFRTRRSLESGKLARNRKVNWIILAGCIFGAAAAYFGGVPLFFGVVLGGLAGAMVGVFVTRWPSA